MNAEVQRLLSSPYVVPLVIAVVVNVVVLATTIILFKILASTASVQARKWTAGGALAGYIILTGVEIYLINKFAPQPIEQYPSYAAVREFYDAIQSRHFEEAWAHIHPQFQANRWKSDIKSFKAGY